MRFLSGSHFSLARARFSFVAKNPSPSSTKKRRNRIHDGKRAVRPFLNQLFPESRATVDSKMAWRSSGTTNDEMVNKLKSKCMRIL
jgi:hypothetical protein